MMMMMEKKICRFNYTGEQERESLALALALSLSHKDGCRRHPKLQKLINFEIIRVILN
jgi:hypothetical protein